VGGRGLVFFVCVGPPETLIFQRHLKRKHGIPSQCVRFSGSAQRFLRKIIQKVRKKRVCLITDVGQKLAIPANPWRKILPYE